MNRVGFFSRQTARSFVRSNSATVPLFGLKNSLLSPSKASSANQFVSFFPSRNAHTFIPSHNKEVAETPAIVLTDQEAIVRLAQSYPVIMPILHACAYLAAEAIPISWLETRLSGSPEISEKFNIADIRQGLDVLQNHAVLHTEKMGMLRIHPTVQQYIRQQLSPAAQEKQIEQTHAWLYHLNPQKGGNKLEEEAWRVFLPHLKSIVQHHDKSGLAENLLLANTLSTLGALYLGSFGLPAQARDCLARALAIREAQCGVDHYSLASILGNLGTAYAQVGDFHQQRRLLERALVIKETYYGLHHYQVAVTLGSLASSYTDPADLHVKITLLERALTIQETHYGLNHNQLAVTLTNLGNAYGELGEVRRQCEILKRALSIKKKHYGADHPAVAITLGGLSNAYAKLGQTDQQRILLERILHIQETHYGPTHYMVASTLWNLSMLYGKQGDFFQERICVQRAYHIFMHHPALGPDHPQTKKYIAYLLADGKFSPEEVSGVSVCGEENNSFSPRI